MELWIRSQDKRKLIPIKEELYIPYSRTGEDFGIFYKGNILAHFKKEERALEVLDEIQKKIRPITIIKQTKPIKYIDYNMTISDITLYVENVSEFKEVGTIIYEMPKE